MYTQRGNHYWDDAIDEGFQKPNYSAQKPNYSAQKPDYSAQKPNYSAQKLDYSAQKPDYSVQKSDNNYQKPVNSYQKPEYSVQKPDYSVQKKGYSVQKPEVAKRVAKNTGTDREMKRSEKETNTVKLKRSRNEEYDVEQASINDENDGLKTFGRRVVFVEGEGVHGSGERLRGEAENSDCQQSDNELDSDISEPVSDNDDGLCQSQMRRGSYDLIDDEAGSQRGKAAGTDSEGELETDGESTTSISGTDSDSYHSNIDDGEVMNYGGDGADIEIRSSTTAEFRGDKRDKSGTLVSSDRGENPLCNSKDIHEQSTRPSDLNSMSANNTKIARTPSYQRACSRESTSSETFDNDHFGEDGVESQSDSESLQGTEQLDSTEGAEDPHGLIRKPAVRRRGFAWASKSLPINSKAARMKQHRKQNLDSSQDLGPSLLTLYDHKISTGARDGDNDGNDDDYMLIDIGEAPKTKSLPARADKFTIDVSQYSEKRESPQRLSTGLREVVVDNDLLGPMVHTTLDDAKKRPLSISSASSNSFTYSPRLRKKKTIGFSGDDHGVFMEDLQDSNKAAVTGMNSKTSTFDSRASDDSGFVQRTRDRDRHSDSMSITSSETDSLGNEAESNIAKDCSRMTSSASDPLNVSQSNKPLPGSNLTSSLSGPGFTDYNNTSYVLVALDGQPGTPSSCSEMGHPFPDPQSPVIRAYTKTGRPTKADVSRHSSSSTSSRHEARMKFFSNYEEYMSQSSPPQVSSLEENLRISSESQPRASSKNSSTPTTSESAAETKDINHSPLLSSAHTSTVPFTPSLTSSDGVRDTFPKIGRRSERTSRRSDRRSSNSKHEGFSTSSRSGFSRSSKKRDLTASDAGSRSSQGYTSYVFRAVTEIIESERTYIASLEDIIHGYLEPMEKMLSSNDVKKDIEVLFSNIRDIYKFGCTFLADLETASTDCVKVAQCFVRHNKGFVIYTDYCTNYPRAVEVLTRFMQHPELSELCKERQLALGHGLPLGAYLLRPVQRILKYHLLLQNIVKNCEKEKAEVGIIEQAFHHMTEMAHHINEMKRKHEHAVRIQEIQSQLEDYVGEDLTRLGELVLEGTFKIYGAKASRQVFLFERGLLICKKSEGGMLSCKAFVLCSNLMLVEVIPNEPLSFHIIPFNNPRAQYTLQARNMEQKRLWCQNIKELILESFKGRIPDNVKNLIMQLGREHDDDYVSKEAMEAGRKNQHTAPEYLEKRKVRGKSGSRIPDFSLLRPQKAKRGGNKKVDLRPGQISPEVNRRAKSKSPERHHQHLSRQNAAKTRSLSSNSPAKPVAAFCKLIANPVQAITQVDDKTEGRSPPTPESTFPESPVFRKSRKFTYFRNNDGESPTTGKAAEIPKRPLSFLMARANPILSADLTQLLARCGGSIKIQCPALSNSEDNDKIHPSHTVIEEYSEPSLNNTSDMNKTLASEQIQNETNLVQDIKFSDTDTSLSATDNTESHTATETTAVMQENDTIALSSLNHTSLSDTDSESISSLTKKVLEKDADKTCECDNENEIYFEESNDISERVDHIYENVKISEDIRDKHNDDQSFIKNEETTDISEHEIKNVGTEINVTENHDKCNNTSGESELKKPSLRLPNTTQHLLTHEGGLTDRVKAKLTNWNSVDKLTKGSMNDVSHLNDDPWVRNSDTANSIINTEAKSSESLKLPMPTTSKPLNKSDITEMMQVSNNKETLDWLVYLNKSSTSLKYQSSMDEKRMSTPILNRHSIVQQNLENKNKPWSQVSNDTPTGEHMTYENMKRLGLIKDQNRDESFFQNKHGNNSSTSSRKVNAFGMSPTITMARPISLSSSSGLFRSSSTPISEIKNFPLAKATFKERPASLDIDILTSKGHRVRTQINKHLSNSSEYVENLNKIPNNIPSTKGKDEEADSNRLSIVSSTSTASHESQSSGSSDGLIGRPESELHLWEKTSKSRPESKLHLREKTSKSRPESELHLREKTSKSRPESELHLREKTSKSRPESELHLREKTSKSRPESDISCASTLTSDDEDRVVHPKSGNTFEPPSKIRSSWKEDRQLETVLLEHGLGSSKLGSRMANSITQSEHAITHHCSNSSGHEPHPQGIYSDDPVNKITEQPNELSLGEIHFPTQVKPSLTTTAEVTETLEPITLTNCNLPAPTPELSSLNNELNMKDFSPPKPETALELSEQPSKERASHANQKRSKAKTGSESSNFARSESLESSTSTDSCYERKLSAAFDSDIFQEMPEFEKRNDRDLKEALLLKKSIREYVKDIEDKFKAPSPKVFEVKRREPGAMIRQRLQTLKESALHGWRSSSISSSKVPNEESSLKYSNYDRRTLYINRDNSLDSNSNSVCLRPSRSRDSLSQSVDNLSKSRDNIFASRDSLSSMSISRDSLISLSNSPGCRHSAPVFSLKTTNAGHEKDANRFHYKAPEESQTILGNQFVHRRTYGSSQSSLLESELQSSQEKETGPVKTSKLMHQHSDLGNETENLVVMKGWVRSLISKFQVNS